jgi:hypothetical protein
MNIRVTRFVECVEAIRDSRLEPSHRVSYIPRPGLKNWDMRRGRKSSARHHDFEEL